MVYFNAFFFFLAFTVKSAEEVKAEVQAKGKNFLMVGREGMGKNLIP